MKKPTKKDYQRYVNLMKKRIDTIFKDDPDYDYDILIGYQDDEFQPTPTKQSTTAKTDGD